MIFRLLQYLNRCDILNYSPSLSKKILDYFNAELLDVVVFVG
jgi:hypothetical protein